MSTDKGMTYNDPPPGYSQGQYGVQPAPGYSQTQYGMQPAPGTQQPTYNQVTNLPTQTPYLQTQPHQPGATFRYRSRPAFVVCQFCGASVTTELSHKVGTFTWLSAGFVCLIGLVAGCCLIPFCLDICKDCEHICPNCKKVVGVFKQVT